MRIRGGVLRTPDVRISESPMYILSLKAHSLYDRLAQDSVLNTALYWSSRIDVHMYVLHRNIDVTVDRGTCIIEGHEAWWCCH